MNYRAVGVAGLLLLLRTPSLQAQTMDTTTVAFSIHVVASLPDAPTGVGLRWAQRGKMGFYAEVKTGQLGKPSSNFLDGVTFEQAEATGGDVLAERTSWVISALGINYWMQPRLALYGGVGYSQGKRYFRYTDPGDVLTSDGTFWIEKTEDRSTGVNFNGGLLYRLSGRLWAQFGLDTRPQAFNVGLGFIFASN